MGFWLLGLCSDCLGIYMY